jgi:uncharacterized linocin/CFP29 family protein
MSVARLFRLWKSSKQSIGTGSLVLGQDMQVDYLETDAAHENFAVSESVVLKIEAPDAICIVAPASKGGKR